MIIWLVAMNYCALTAIFWTLLGTRGWAGILVIVLVPSLTLLMGVGNVDAAVMLGIIVVWTLVAAERPKAAGILVGVLASLKLTPAIFLIWFIARRQWTAVGWTVATGLVLAAVAVIGTEPGIWVRYARVIVEGSAAGRPGAADHPRGGDRRPVRGPLATHVVRAGDRPHPARLTGRGRPFLVDRAGRDGAVPATVPAPDRGTVSGRGRAGLSAEGSSRRRRRRPWSSRPLEPLDERVLGRAGRDHDRDLPVVELLGPAVTAVDDPLVVVPDLDREQLDPRVDRDRRLRELEDEPRAPRLRIEEAVARLQRPAQRPGDPRRRVADDPGRRAEARVDRSPHGQQHQPGDHARAPTTTTFMRRISGGSTRSGPVAAVTSVPAIAATAPSGHHATPRMANAPIRKKTPSQASVGHEVVRPRRAISTTIAPALAKNSMPGTVRSVVACHSVIRCVTCGLVDSPTA